VHQTQPSCQAVRIDDIDALVVATVCNIVHVWETALRPTVSVSRLVLLEAIAARIVTTQLIAACPCATAAARRRNPRIAKRVAVLQQCMSHRQSPENAVRAGLSLVSLSDLAPVAIGRGGADRLDP
jgi:hypothetical protein